MILCCFSLLFPMPPIRLSISTIARLEWHAEHASYSLALRHWRWKMIKIMIPGKITRTLHIERKRENIGMEVTCIERAGG
jgi:hypothetical protein